MSSKPAISVILANYNGEQYLHDSIESVLAQTFEDLEFIIVDDGSTDSSTDIISAFALRHPEKICPQFCPRNRGQASAFNVGISAARAELVSFIDSDDIWFPNKLQTVAETFGDPEQVALHQHNLRLIEDGKLTAKAFRHVLVVGDYFRHCQDRPGHLPQFIATTGLTFSRRALLEVGPIPEAFRTCADGYLTRTTFCYGMIAMTDDFCGAYRVHPGNNTFQNSSFDSQAYTQDLLIPNLNRFYEERGIKLSFPVQSEMNANADVPNLEDVIESIRVAVKAFNRSFTKLWLHFQLPQGVLGTTLANLRDRLRRSSPNLCRPDPSVFSESIHSFALEPEDKILMLRSAEMEVVEPLLECLLQESSEISVDLLIQDSCLDSIESSRVQKFSIEDGPVSASSISETIRRKISSSRYRLGLIPYSGLSGDGYDNVHAILRGLSSCDFVGIGRDGARHPLDARSLFLAQLSVQSSLGMRVDRLYQTLQSLGLGPRDRVLMLRCADTRVVQDILALLFHLYPRLEVDLIVQDSQRETFQDERVRQFLIKDGPITTDSFTEALLEEIQSNSYALTLVPYSNPHGLNYDNVHRILPTLARGRFVGVGSDGSKHNLSRLIRLVRVVLSFVIMILLFPILLLLKRLALKI